MNGEDKEVFKMALFLPFLPSMCKGQRWEGERGETHSMRKSSRHAVCLQLGHLGFSWRHSPPWHTEYSHCRLLEHQWGAGLLQLHYHQRGAGSSSSVSNQWGADCSTGKHRMGSSCAKSAGGYEHLTWLRSLRNFCLGNIHTNKL